MNMDYRLYIPLLGVSNRAFPVRADVDLNELAASATASRQIPTDGTYWLDTDDSLYGIPTVEW